MIHIQDKVWISEIEILPCDLIGRGDNLYLRVILAYEYLTIWVNLNLTCLLNGLEFLNSNTTYLLNGSIVLTCLSDFIKMKKKKNLILVLTKLI